MIFEAAAGIMFGSLGAIPFIHPNLILQTMAGFFLGSFSLAIFAVTLSVSHAFFSVAPSLMVLNGFSSEKNGSGITKIFKIALGALVLAIAVLPFAWFLLPFLKSAWGESYKYIFLAIIISNFLPERGPKAAIGGSSIFLLSGIFGTITFFRGIVAEPLFPMLSGFFAVPALLLGRENGWKREFLEVGIGDGVVNLPNRDSPSIFGEEKSLVLACVFASAISTLFPAMTVGVMLGLLMLTLRDDRALGIAVPALIVSKVFYDIVAAGITGNTRSFASVLALPFMEIYGKTVLLLVAGMAMIAGCIACAFCLKFERRLEELQAIIETENLRKAILAGILMLVFLFGGMGGILITATSASLGVLGQKAGARRSYLMGALLVPALIFQFGLSEDVKTALF